MDEKAEIVINHFMKKYDEEKCKFIITRISPGGEKYSAKELIEIGEKIAFFNDWTTISELKDLGIK